MTPLLESKATALNYGELPETWRVPNIDRFSPQKTLYDYQRSALENAARALYRYYEQQHDWHVGESEGANTTRKLNFATQYGYPSGSLAPFTLHRDKSPIFDILSEFIEPHHDQIPYHHLINRLCFWMATGSGKTLVMIKLIEYLHHLIQHGEIPQHNVLLLAPSEYLLGQIRRTVDEFNSAGGLQIDLLPLRQAGRAPYQRRLGDALTVYYHRSDNLSDVHKEAMTDYRVYENGGKWYVFLDEAHKGGKEDSKRQAYYAVMARQGFLFNFSATFTDEEDILTTVKKYNLEEFVRNGHGKHVYLNEEEYTAFNKRNSEISHDERKKIVLKSLITLGYVSLRVNELREGTGLSQLYHQPLMLTLVHSVNTDIENEQNDLWAFFQTLREIATGEIDEKFFKDAKGELIKDWRNARLLFGENGAGLVGTDETTIQRMRLTDLREAVFRARRRGALQFILSKDNKELAFQMKNADAPFALIRIGDTTKWRNNLLAGFEETTALQKKSFFDELEKSPITILMGSRSFFESWDTNRPNVINFINIGGTDAKKFVVQSVGRGVRIETLPDRRLRFSHLSNCAEKDSIQPYHDKVQPAETLFLFATNRTAVATVLAGLEAEKSSAFEVLEGFEKAPRAKVGDQEMELLVPEYRETQGSMTMQARFAMSQGTLDRLIGWFEKTSDSVLAVRDGLATSEITGLRNMIEQTDRVRIKPDKCYARLPFLQDRLISHLALKPQDSDVRKLNDTDIVHFRHVSVHPEYVRELTNHLNQVAHGRSSDEEIVALTKKLASREITREEFNKHVAGEDEITFKNLRIKKIARHYYLPVILGDETSDYIRHIIKVKSEVKFLEALEEWTQRNEVPWDAWMFSKIDESLDEVYLPYYNAEQNDYSRFLPDFVFWMCRGNEYRIVFVDPKGSAHTSAYRKIDGYKVLFEQGGDGAPVREFSYGKRWKVSVGLLMYNAEAPPSQAYQRYWADDPARIFHPA